MIIINSIFNLQINNPVSVERADNGLIVRGKDEDGNPQKFVYPEDGENFPNDAEMKYNSLLDEYESFLNAEVKSQKEQIATEREASIQKFKDYRRSQEILNN